MKAAIARITTSGPGRSFFRWLMGHRVAVLTLHRFCRPGSDASGHDPRFIRQVLSDLRSKRVPVLSLREVVDGLAQGQAMRGVCFTVDDGYQNFFRHGAPVFQELDCPVTVFLTTGFIDGEYWFWWDRITYAFQNSPLATVDVPVLEQRVELGDGRHRKEVARLVSGRIKTLPQDRRPQHVQTVLESLEAEIPEAPPTVYEPLTWHQVRSLHERGFEFGPHSVRHLSFRTARPGEVREEVNSSFARLREELPSALQVFCYPYGTEDDVSPEVAEIVAEEGMKGALTTIPGYVRSRGKPTTSRFLIPRFGMPDNLLDFGQIAYGVERGKEIWRGLLPSLPAS